MEYGRDETRLDLICKYLLGQGVDFLLKAFLH